MNSLPIFFNADSRQLGQTCGCHGASKVTLEYMGKIDQWQTMKKVRTMCIIRGVYCALYIEYLKEACHFGGHCLDYYPGAVSQIARFMGPTWGPSGADRIQVGPMLAPWTLLSGVFKSSLCNSFEDQASVAADFIYRCQIFKWIVETWLHDRVPC